MSAEEEYDVLIVGCGPVGATLANLLRMRNRKVAIFDRDKHVFHAPRAMVIDAESCRIYQGMGILERLLEQDASPFSHHRFVNADRKLSAALDFSTLETELGHPALGLMYHQPALERILRDDFTQGIGVEAHLGHEVLKVENCDGGVQLTARDLDTGTEQTYRGKFVVGCDGGGESVCRTAMDTRRIDLNYSRKWIVMDVIVHDSDLWNSFTEGSEFRCRPNSAVVFVKGHHNHVRFDFEVTDERAETFHESDARELISEYFDTSSIEIIRLAPYTFYAGMPDRWRDGRLFLAGDSAHRTSPFAGQGLNMGIRDAANLAFKFDMVLDGILGDRFLDTYQEERWENCAYLINSATKRGQMISAEKLGERMSREFAFFIARNFPKLALKAAIGGDAMPPYRHGFIGESSSLSGTRFFQPTVLNSEGDPVLLDTLVDDRFALICRDQPNGSACDWFRNEFGGTVLALGQNADSSTDLLSRYFMDHKVEAVLVRPDRYVFDAGTDADVLCDAFRKKVQSYAEETNQQSLKHSVT